MGPENTPHPAQFRLNKFIYIYIYICFLEGEEGVVGDGGGWVIACC